MSAPFCTPNMFPIQLRSVSGAVVPNADLDRVNWLKEILPNETEQRDYARERGAIVLTEAIGDAMEAANLNRSELAERLGRHKSYITRALSARQNITIKTLSDLLWACGMEIESLQLAPVGEALLPRAEAESFMVETLTRSPQTSLTWSSAEATGNVAPTSNPSASAVTLDSTDDPKLAA
jgi:antitoxin component HigA of HigAB toxin-antitoxin module